MESPVLKSFDQDFAEFQALRDTYPDFLRRKAPEYLEPSFLSFLRTMVKEHESSPLDSIREQRLARVRWLWAEAMSRQMSDSGDYQGQERYLTILISLYETYPQQFPSRLFEEKYLRWQSFKDEAELRVLRKTKKAQAICDLCQGKYIKYEAIEARTVRGEALRTGLSLYYDSLVFRYKAVEVMDRQRWPSKRDIGEAGDLLAEAEARVNGMKKVFSRQRGLMTRFYRRHFHYICYWSSLVRYRQFVLANDFERAAQFLEQAMKAVDAFLEVSRETAIFPNFFASRQEVALEHLLCSASQAFVLDGDVNAAHARINEWLEQVDGARVSTWKKGNVRIRAVGLKIVKDLLDGTDPLSLLSEARKLVESTAERFMGAAAREWSQVIYQLVQSAARRTVVIEGEGWVRNVARLKSIFALESRGMDFDPPRRELRLRAVDLLPSELRESLQSLRRLVEDDAPPTIVRREVGFFLRWYLAISYDYLSQKLAVLVSRGSVEDDLHEQVEVIRNYNDASIDQIIAGLRDVNRRLGYGRLRKFEARFRSVLDDRGVPRPNLVDSFVGGEIAPDEALIDLVHPTVMEFFPSIITVIPGTLDGEGVCLCRMRSGEAQREVQMTCVGGELLEARSYYLGLRWKRFREGAVVRNLSESPLFPAGAYERCQETSRTTIRSRLRDDLQEILGMGGPDWAAFQELVTDIWAVMFPDDLRFIGSEISTEGGSYRRDAAFSNISHSGFWARMRERWDADVVFLEVKDMETIGSREVGRFAASLRVSPAAGRLGILVGRGALASTGAREINRSLVFDNILILFVSAEDLLSALRDPAQRYSKWIADLYESVAVTQEL